MPQIFKIGGYIIYFWMNESNPLEPVHVHVCQGIPSPTATKIWITKNGNSLLCHNKSQIPPKQLRFIMQVVEARHQEIIDFWFQTFRQISFYI